MMVTARRSRWGYTPEDFRNDPLVQRLRNAVLNNRDKNLSDRIRAVRYNVRARVANLPFRARVR